MKASLKSRFILIAVVLAVLMLMSALFIQSFSEDASDEYRANTEQYDMFERQLDSLWFNLHTIESQIYLYVLLHEDALPAKIRAELQRARQHIEKLRQFDYTITNSTLRQTIIRLNSLLIKLENDSNELIKVLETLETRFPGMGILLSTLQPVNNEFINQNFTAMQLNDLPIKDPVKFRINKLFQSIRYNWAQQVSSVRVFIANRSGVFGDPKKTMRANLRNREIYSELVRKELDDLLTYRNKGQLSLEQSEALTNMDELWKQYERYFANVKQAVSSDSWRSDLILISDQIRPLFGEVWTTFQHIQQEQEAYYSRALSSQNQITDGIRLSAWVYVAVVYLLLMLAYLAFEYMFRRPLIELASSIGDRPIDNFKATLFKANTQEATAFIDAFQNIHQQIAMWQHRVDTVLDNVHDAILTFDEHGIIKSFNQAAEELFGYSDREVIDKNINILIQEESRTKIASVLAEVDFIDGNMVEKKIIAQHKDGKHLSVQMNIMASLVGNERKFTAIISDISERNAIDNHLKNIAERDPLTGISNRQQFIHELERMVKQKPAAHGQVNLLLYLGIDNFKYVNDTLGHHSGDRVIIEIADMLARHTLDENIIARIGGDEFGILLFNINEASTDEIVNTYREIVEQYKFRSNGMVISLTCSIGACVANDNISGKEELLARADLAYNAAKHRGKNRVHFYAAEDEKSLKDMADEIRWVRIIKQALEEDRFRLASQSIINTQTGRVSHYEVLLCLLDETDNVILPAGFMPTAERFGMMQDIDAWVIQHAIEILSKQRKFLPGVKFCINLSGASLTDRKVLNVITNEIEKHNIPPSLLTFEITETVAISNLSAASEFLAILRRLGCETSLDDFGTGYSSFAYLKDLPADYVKIDGSFVCDIDRNESHMVMVRSMNEVAHAMGKQTIAEFVENEECMRILRDIGVDFCQGYYFDRPAIINPNVSLQDGKATLANNIESLDKYR